MGCYTVAVMLALQELEEPVTVQDINRKLRY